MKNKSAKILKSIIILMMFFIIFQLSQTIIAYEIIHEADLINQVENEEFGKNKLVYKKEVSAYADTIRDFNNGVYNLRNGWAYKVDNPTRLSQDDPNYDNNGHSNRDSFERYYEFFHPEINSHYNTTDLSNPYKRYYSTYTSYITNNYPESVNAHPQPLYNVWGETGNYHGLYDGVAGHNADTGMNIITRLNVSSSPFRLNDQNAVLVRNNWYKFAVINGTYVSYNVIETDTISELWSKFKDKIVNNKLEIYVSSVLRTSSANNNGNKNYYQNMDTAYKFWETTVRGANSGRWDGSPSTTGRDTFNTNSYSGHWSNAPETSEKSAINYYDNTLKLPRGTNSEVYVRHIDVSNLSVINSETVEAEISANPDKMLTAYGRGFIHNGGWGVVEDYVERENKGRTTVEADTYKFTEKYVNPTTEKHLVVGNIRYGFDNTNQETPSNKIFSYWGALSAEDKAKFETYKCLGAVVGKGENIQKATDERDKLLPTNRNFRDAPQNDSSGNTRDTGGINTNRNWTTVNITNDEHRPVIVIDFYYEKPETKVYVRHIDVDQYDDNIGDSYLGGGTTKRLIPSNEGLAFVTNKSNWDVSLESITANRTSIKPDGNFSNVIYQEEFIKPLGDSPLRIANIKYNHNTAGSYWNNLSVSDQDKFEQYECVASAVGKGKRADLAEVNKSAIKNEVFANSKNKLLKEVSNAYLNKQSPDKLFTKNGDWTSVLLEDNNYEVVVIDFYYTKKPTIQPSYKNVYVRHVDVTGKATLSANTVDSLIRTGKVLSGLGVAEVTKPNNEKISLAKSETTPNGYQELYQTPDVNKIVIKRDPNDAYTCIGSNMTTNNAGNLTVAQNSMNNLLNTNSYNATLNSQRESSGSNNDIIIIDFYYRNKHEGIPIERTPVGRLAFYTISGISNQFSSTVDNKVSNNSGAPTIDAIPSGETLRPSTDNAYTFMLGGINIKEQEKMGEQEFNYDITQNYKVNYKDWKSWCEGPCDATNSDKDIRVASGEACGNTYKSGTRPTYDSEGNVTGSEPVYSTCTGSWKASYDTISTTSSTTVRYTYKIPYKYTYYKVKNMRIYSINKMELNDGYNNYGLPLFDGKTHLTTPTTQYNNSFAFKDDNFKESSNGQTPSSTAKTLSGTLLYEYNNEDEDVEESVPKGDGKEKVEQLFDTHVSHTTAARLSSITKEGTPTLTSSITTELKVNNDKISFKDEVSGKNIVIIGDDKDESNNTRTINVNIENTYENSYKRDYEFNAIKIINLSEYTKTKTKTKKAGATIPTYTYNTTEADRINVKTKYPEKTQSYYEPKDYLTDNRYFNVKQLNIPKERVNGKRYSVSNIQYDIISGNKNLNFDVKDSNANNGNHSWTRTAVSGSSGDTFIDTEMYRKNVAKLGATTLITPGTLSSIIWDYGTSNNSKNDSDIVNVFTPVSFNTYVRNLSNDKFVNHTDTSISNQIQKNSRFTIDIETKKHSKYSGNYDIKKYIGEYYIKFDFDVQDIIIYDMKNTIGRNYTQSVVNKNTWIGPIYNNINTRNGIY